MKLLISGYYGYGNLGDEAIAQALAGSLLQEGHQVTLLSGQPRVSRQMHALPAVHRYWGLLPALLRHDALISGGGGLLQDKTSARSLQYYLSVIRLAKRLGKKVVVYGQSIGPLSATGRDKVAAVLKDVPIAVRDEASLVYLRTLGLESTLVADAALLLEPGLSAPGVGILLIPRHGYPDMTDALIELARKLRERNIPVACTALHPVEDDSEVRRLKQAVPLAYHEATSPRALLEIIRGAQFVVSGRLHGLILAAVARVPYAGISYDPKVTAFLRETAAPLFNLPVNHRRLLEVTLEQATAPEELRMAMMDRARSGMRWLHQALIRGTW